MRLRDNSLVEIDCPRASISAAAADRLPQAFVGEWCWNGHCIL
jgi:hypothetical protein